MTKSDLEKLGKSLLAQLPAFTAKGQLLFIRPISSALRAIYFDSSGFALNLFFVHVFVQPLFVPAKHIALNLGWRIGGESHRWDISDPKLQTELNAALKREGIPFLTQVRSPRDIVVAVESLHKSADPYAQQVIAYSLARSGDIKQACLELDRFVELVEPTGYWREEIKRAEVLKKMILADPSEAQRLFDRWENETAINLGLEEFHGKKL